MKRHITDLIFDKLTLALAASLLASCGLGLVFLGVIFYLRDVFGLEPGLIGAFAATWSLSYSVGCFSLQPLASRARPGKILGVAAAGTGVCAFLLTVLPTIEMLFVAYALLGICQSLFWPTLMGWLSHGLEGAGLNRTMSLFNLSWNLGNIFGPLLAGLLSERSPRAPMRVAAVVFGALLVLIALTARQKGRSAESSSEAAGREPVDRSTMLRYPCWLGLFASYIVLGAVLNIFPLYARVDLTFSKSLVGTLLLLRALMGTVGFVLLGQTGFWHFRLRYLFVVQLLLAALLAILGHARSAWLNGVLLSAIGMCLPLIYVYSLFHGVAGSRRRSQRMAAHEAILTAGMVVGAIVGGRLYQDGSMAAVFTFCCAAVLTGLGLQLILTFWLRRTGRA